MKKILSVLLIVGIIFFSGCVNYKTTQTFNRNGSSNATVEFDFTNYVNEMLEYNAKEEDLINNLSTLCKNKTIYCNFDKDNYVLTLKLKIDEGYTFDEKKDKYVLDIKRIPIINLTKGGNPVRYEKIRKYTPKQIVFMKTIISPPIEYIIYMPDKIINAEPKEAVMSINGSKVVYDLYKIYEIGEPIHIESEKNNLCISLLILLSPLICLFIKN